jgi:S1-C subfamily serine protease
MDAHACIPLIMMVMFYPAPREPDPDDRGQGFFGVRMIDNGGVSIDFVQPGSPADKAGIRANDVFQTIDSTPVSTLDEAREVIGRLRPGTIVLAVVRRGAKTLSIKIKAGVRPELTP